MTTTLATEENQVGDERYLPQLSSSQLINCAERRSALTARVRPRWRGCVPATWKR